MRWAETARQKNIIAVKCHTVIVEKNFGHSVIETYN